LRDAFYLVIFTCGCNFQFTQIVFGFLGGVTTAALIQFIIARIVFPFFIGNGFCSRACWDGAIFELFRIKFLKQNAQEKEMRSLHSHI